MQRKGHDSVNFFIGTEVEHTPAHGMKTLFVVGLMPIEQIQSKLTDPFVNISQPCRHIFFGANHSFAPVTAEEWQSWEQMIEHFLNLDYVCSLDIPITHVEEFNDGGLCEHRNFIPQIRVSIPYTKLWNYNTMLKIDDKDFAATNPGVWCHSLHSLMSRRTFTDWREYSKDQPV